MQKNDEEDDQEMGAEMNDFHLQQQHQDQQQQVSRQMMQVRKVRSEIKYMENYTKDKKRESKSDHEFANERDVSKEFEISRSYNVHSFPFPLVVQA